MCNDFSSFCEFVRPKATYGPTGPETHYPNFSLDFNNSRDPDGKGLGHVLLCAFLYGNITVT